MKLSIITINYNNLSGLKKTVESIKSQTFKDYEWILIDGGSHDGSEKYIAENSHLFSFWCTEKDTGIYNAINKGLDHAVGDYVLFSNSGDWLYDLNTLTQVFSRDYSGDVLYGDMIQVNGAKHHQIQYPEKLNFFFFLYDSLCHQATFFKRTLFEGRRYDENYRIVSDWAMNLQFALEGKRFEHLPYPVVYYDNSGISANADDSLLIAERMDAYEKIVPPVLKNEVDRYNQNYHFTRKRKSLRIIMDKAISLCKTLDAYLSKREQPHKHKHKHKQ